MNQEGFSAKNMGKNDLWIAATAATTGATLVSTDNDFAHLNKVFFDFMLVKT
jgi:tRNA(fMet)-specific endonuclease VapC